MDRILEDEAPEAAAVDAAVLDQLERFGDHFGHVLHVEVPDVGAEQRLDLGAARVVVPLERPGVVRVVRLAAEVEGFDEEVLEVVLAGDAAGRIVVQLVDAAGGALVVGRADAGPGTNRVDHSRAPILLGERQQQRGIEVGGVHFLQRFPVADRPVADEVGVEQAGETDAALQEREVEGREAAGDAA